MEKENQLRKKFDYKWVIVALSFVMVFTCMGFCHANKSLYLGAITEALGMKRSAFSVSDSIRFITTALINLFFGFFTSRFGTKKLICAGFCSLIACMLIYANSETLIGFYIGGAFLGIGMSFTSTGMVGSVVNKWCTKNRGAITGAILASSGIGGAFAAQIVTPIIYNPQNPFGYRDAYNMIVIILIAVGLLVVFFFKDKPSDDVRKTAPAKKKRGAAWGGISFADAKRKPYFYVTVVGIFATGMVLQGVNGITATYMIDVGFDADFVAKVLLVHSLALTAFKFVLGFVYDRFGLRLTVLICDVASIIMMTILAFLYVSAIGRLSAMIYAIFSAMAIPLETVMLPIIANDVFGDKEYSKFLGIIMCTNTTGYAVGIPLANVIFDTFGSYRPMFYGCIILAVLITIIFQYVAISAQKMRNSLNHN